MGIPFIRACPRRGQRQKPQSWADKLLVRAYLVVALWHGLRLVQRDDIRVKAAAVTHNCVTVWDDEHLVGEGIEIRLKW